MDSGQCAQDFSHWAEQKLSHVDQMGAEIGQRKSSAQITENYQIEDLIGRQVAAVVNFPPKQIGRFMSEILVLGFPDEKGEVVLIQPSKQIPNGARLY